MREKPVMNVDDVYLVLHHHWALDTTPYPDERQRLQLALLILLTSYTASRPGALVDNPTNTKLRPGADNSLWEPETPDIIKGLCWQDVTLLLLPNPSGTRDILAMEVNLRHTKGSEKNPSE